MRYPIGQPIRVSTVITDTTGANVDPGTLTLLVKIAQADGTWLTTGTYASPARDSLGHYHQDIPATDLTAAGHYQYTWTSTGAGAGVSFSEFDVFDPFETNILSLSDAKDMLNIPQATTTYDSELLVWISSIKSGLERFTGGPIVNRQITERCEAVNGMTQIILRQRPVQSLVSVTPESGGGAVSLTDMKIDPNSGIIQRSTGWPIPGPFLFTPWFSVVYVAGWGTSVPPAFDNFARIVIDHNWELQRMPVSLPMSSEEAISVPGFSFLVPRRAYELLNGSQNGIPFTAEAVV
jgi:hypothetical protein